ncbi:MAG: exodeoxyribonuclease VII small subunit [Bacteroidales bacterium]|nr:exodeoxyribonuclease VII small subunit [Bacteroidales bacterium]
MAEKTNKEIETISYADALEELEKILVDIESDTLDLDTLSEKVKRAAFLTKLCKQKLRSTTEEIDKILDDWEE